MPLGYKQLKEIDEADLRQLVGIGEAEGKEIEYKQQLPGDTPDNKREFLADISSFANCVGGDLVFGMKEEQDDQGQRTGRFELPGIQIDNLDTVKQRLENIVRDGIDPRIFGLDLHLVPLANSKSVLIIRIPKSWSAPHMVKGWSKFFSRNSAGKYQLVVGEIRDAFLRAHAVGEKLRSFRAERLGLINSDQGPVPLEGKAKIVLHIVPRQAFDAGVLFDLSPLVASPVKLQPMYCSGWSRRYNFDGVLSYSGGGQGSQCHSYLLVFRNGTIEAVETFLLEPRDDGRRLIPSIAYEQKILEATGRFLNLQKDLGVEPPLALMLTLLNVRGYEMVVDPASYFHDAHPNDRDALAMPEVLIESYDCDVGQALRPCFDPIWNACGWSGSLNYDENGLWRPHR